MLRKDYRGVREKQEGETGGYCSKIQGRDNGGLDPGWGRGMGRGRMMETVE